MRCVDVRKALTARAPQAGGVGDHLTGCHGCRSYAERLASAHEALRLHHAEIRPDAGFAARLAGRLPSREADAMGLAALRLLPAGLLLALLLAGWAWNTSSVTSVTSTVAAEETLPSDDLVAWLLETPDENAGVSP